MWEMVKRLLKRPTAPPRDDDAKKRLADARRRVEVLDLKVSLMVRPSHKRRHNDA